MYITLERLLKSGYVAKRVLPNTDFNNKGGRYYLTPKGFKQLQAHLGDDKTLVPLMYKNKSLSEAYVDQYIATMRLYIALRDIVGDDCNIFTKTELAPYEGIPVPLPELYIRCDQPVPGYSYESFMLVCFDMPLFLIKKRFKELIDHAEDEGWADEQTPYYPELLFVVNDEAIEKRFHAFACTIIDNMGLEDDLDVKTTTRARMLQDLEPNKIWKQVLLVD